MAPVPGLCFSFRDYTSKVWRAFWPPSREESDGRLKPQSIQTQPSLKQSMSDISPINKPKTTLNNGYLGSRIDEERSEMRYVV